MVYLATQITDPSLLVSGWYHPSFVGQTSHIFKNFLYCTKQWTSCINILHIIPCTMFIALCIMSVVWVEWVSVCGISGFSFLCFGRRTVRSRLFQLVISEMAVVVIAWCSAFLLEEERRLHHKNGPKGETVQGWELVSFCLSVHNAVWHYDVGKQDLCSAFPFICWISIYSPNINWTSVVK